MILNFKVMEKIKVLRFECVLHSNHLLLLVNNPTKFCQHLQYDKQSPIIHY